jgi:hypothetical protein
MDDADLPANRVACRLHFSSVNTEENMRGHLCVAVVAFGAVLAAMERPAEACGGCFHDDPPGPTPRPPALVTDHRMIVSISKQQTTLYDELRYSGSPASFAWVLPISGSATIGVSSDGLFATLDAMTQVTIVPPPQNCPTPPQSCYAQYGEGDMAPAESAGASSNGGGVTVTAQQTIGPYETVQLHASSGSNALPDWLTSHGYQIPADITPIINAYVAENFDFLALKLVPGTGVQAMRPVRVTTTGASIALPLRMISAGTGANVGIVLWSVSEGRYEPQNFPTFSIKADELEWDWTTNTSNIAQLRSDRSAGGRAWETESSVSFATAAVPGYVTNGYCPPPPANPGNQNTGGGYRGGGAPGGPAIGYACSGPQNDYEAEDGGPGGTTLTKQQVQAEDIQTLLTGIGDNVRVTRMRSTLAHSSLDQDLVLQASADQGELAAVRTVTKEKNQPTCSVYQGCNVVGQAPRDEAWAKSDFSSANNETASCAVTKRGESKGALLGLGALAALVVVAAKRLRRK